MIARRVFFNILNALAAGVILVLGGMFLTVWTWGIGFVVAIPMALAALALPFWAAYQGMRGRDWLGQRPQKRLDLSSSFQNRQPAPAY